MESINHMSNQKLSSIQPLLYIKQKTVNIIYFHTIISVFTNINKLFFISRMLIMFTQIIPITNQNLSSSQILKKEKKEKKWHHV